MFRERKIKGGVRETSKLSFLRAVKIKLKLKEPEKDEQAFVFVFILVSQSASRTYDDATETSRMMELAVSAYKYTCIFLSLCVHNTFSSNQRPPNRNSQAS